MLVPKFLTDLGNFIKARIGNLVSDLTEIEGILATITTLGGTITSLTAGNSSLQRIVGAGLASISVVTLLIHKALTAFAAANTVVK